MKSSPVRTFFAGKRLWPVLGTGSHVRQDLAKSMEYLVTHKGGSVTLEADAYGARANEYFTTWSKMNAEGAFNGCGYRACLKRTPTGLELQVQ